VEVHEKPLQKSQRAQTPFSAGKALLFPTLPGFDAWLCGVAAVKSTTGF